MLHHKFLSRSLLWVVLAILAMLSLVSCDQATEDGLQVGSSAPDFSLPGSNGRIIALADYKGQPVLLYFHMANG